MRKNFPVRPEKVEDLYTRMEANGVFEQDLDEHFIRCPGRGGQKVNKTSSGVYLRHRPSGLEVKCCSERNQALNRFFARRLLLERVESALAGESSPPSAEDARLRKQKDRRRRRRRSGSEPPAHSGKSGDGP